MESTEFYNTPEGCVMYKPIGKPVQELTIDSRAVIEEMLDTAWELFSTYFKPEETGIKKALIDKYWKA